MEAVLETGTKTQNLWEVKPQKWDCYTGNNVIDAYLQGKRDGLESHQRILAKALAGNIAKCGDYVQRLFRHLRAQGFAPREAFLRINDIDLFDIMVCVPKRDFWNEDFGEAYRCTWGIKDELEASDAGFSIEFSFLGFHDNYSMDKIFEDGFVLKYGGTGHAA